MAQGCTRGCHEVVQSRAAGNAAIPFVSFHDFVTSHHLTCAFVYLMTKVGSTSDTDQVKCQKLHSLAFAFASSVLASSVDHFFSRQTKEQFKAVLTVTLCSLSDTDLEGSTRPRHLSSAKHTHPPEGPWLHKRTGMQIMVLPSGLWFWFGDQGPFGHVGEPW